MKVLNFERQKNFLGLLIGVWIKTYFPLKSPIIYPAQIIILSSLLKNPCQILLEKGTRHRQIVYESKLNFQMSHLYIY